MPCETGQAVVKSHAVIYLECDVSDNCTSRKVRAFNTLALKQKQEQTNKKLVGHSAERLPKTDAALSILISPTLVSAEDRSQEIKNNYTL